MTEARPPSDPWTASAARDPDAFWSSVPVAALVRAQSIDPAALDGPMMTLTDQERVELAEALDELHDDPAHPRP